MTTKFNFLTLFSCLPFLCYIHLFSLSPIEARSKGFSIDLIYRDSPNSPFYNDSQSQFDRLKNAFHRSISRASQFKYAMEGVQSRIIGNNGEYLMEIKIGTPPVKTLAIADTGSDLTWIQCKPCASCFKQQAPPFDPKGSSTYRHSACQSKICTYMQISECNSSRNVCEYRVDYGDYSHTIGDLAAETFTFDTSTAGRAIKFRSVGFGCGYDNGGTFDESESGIVGLGGGRISLIKQLSKSIRGKFSYCLQPLSDTSNATSKMNFGDKAVVSGPGVVSTPLISGDPDTFYYVTLKGLSIDNKRVEYKSTSAKAENSGNMIVDSGTTLTYLPYVFHRQIVSALKKAINAKPVDDPQGIFSLCYKTQDKVKFPVITVHFEGVDVKLYPFSTYMEVEDGLSCFTMISAFDIAIYGNLSQMDFHVGYDLVNKKLSFKPTDCAKH